MTIERTSLATGAAVLAIIGGLWSVDLFLARTESRETSTEAEHDFQNGARLMREHQPDEAVDEFRKAYALDRGDQRYALQLAAALIAAGKTAEAQTMLNEILESSPNNGDANLLEARLMAREGKTAEATSYYHRAIFGIWTVDALTRRVQVRMELADFLASRGSDKELLAELLPLETDAHDLPTRKQVAHLYLVAHSPARSAAAYRVLIREDPKDRSDYAGLGQAELALGNYRAAESAFRNADAPDRAALAAEMTSLDPTPRNLSAAEKVARAIRILQLARDSLARCAAADPLVTQAGDLLAQKVRTPTNELAEQRLDLAQQLWAARGTKCGPTTSDEESLRLVLSKLSG
ncbi:MAG: tetratricopeptide repeat protein [Acidobacteriia bacterium]|nr:tetratricopeptide repeat protein [Terriglobia bacterium]